MFYKNLNKSIITYLIISVPLFTLLFSLKKSPLNYTLSKIGYWFDYRLTFILWGAVTAVLLFFTIYNIYKKYNFSNKKSVWLLILALFFLILTVLTPIVDNTFLEDNFNEIDQQLSTKTSLFNLHNIFAFLFSLFLMFSLYLFSKYLHSFNKKIYLKSFKWFLITIGGSLFMIFIFGFSGIFQLFFFISLAVFLFILNIKK